MSARFYLNFDMKDVDRFRKKLQVMNKRIVSELKNKSPKDAAFFMSRQAKMYAPVRSGKLRNDIYAMKEGTGWAVKSSRFNKVTGFPVHEWVNEDFPVNLFGKGIYRTFSSTKQGNNSAHARYFDRATKDTAKYFSDVSRRRLVSILKTRIGGGIIWQNFL